MINPKCKMGKTNKYKRYQNRSQERFGHSFSFRQCRKGISWISPIQSDGEHEDRQRTPHSRKMEILNGPSRTLGSNTNQAISTLEGCPALGKILNTFRTQKRACGWHKKSNGKLAKSSEILEGNARKVKHTKIVQVCVLRNLQWKPRQSKGTLETDRKQTEKQKPKKSKAHHTTLAGQPSNAKNGNLTN